MVKYDYKLQFITMSKETKLGRVVKVVNTDRKQNENSHYFRAWTEDEQGNNEMPLMFTQREIDAARRRAERNKEDWGKRGFFQDLID